MVPHSPVIRGQEARDHFFLIEKPGFDVALIAGAGAEEDISSDRNIGIQQRGCLVDPRNKKTVFCIYIACIDAEITQHTAKII